MDMLLFFGGIYLIALALERIVNRQRNNYRGGNDYD